MAFFVNNKNVGCPIFVKSDEILVPNPIFSENGSSSVFDKIKCEFRVEETSAEKAKFNLKNKDSKLKQNSITSASLSNCGKYICACDSNNCLHLWEHEESNWKILSVRPLTRKCQKAIFTNSSANIILCDRGGDVFDYSVSKCEESGNLILGHISLILDISISNDDKYLATCDRDGKIRISCYPNSYNILSYCLGHQEFVSSIQFIQLAEEILLSGSGDGSIRLWKYKNNGLQFKCVSLQENDILCKACNVQNEAEIKAKLNHEVSEKLVLSDKQVLFSVRCVKYSQEHQLLAVIFHLQPIIAIYKILNDSDDSLNFQQFISLDAPPVDAVFMNNGQLLILIKSTSVSVKCFDYEVENQKFIPIADNDSVAVLKAVQDFYNDFENIHFQDDFVSLFKRVYENNNEDEDCNDVQKKKNKTE
ncbi:tRNA (guanine-N(7)-)-methyltransferase non-catalytic subunit wdr4-like [Argiope bruennichi]|uniref:tRNA (guanine-N(7)-)-methyltransferase non-catalytic subunit wdr4-like n=1 Tax=Argiope bruennichi TaxID=94029 RepID=UPI00249469C9|nr:tRNA (guanine-N(7)-)-methyltransferase non-catalytic subunit wdr4-like [Argiope bruennichi]